MGRKRRLKVSRTATKKEMLYRKLEKMPKRKLAEILYELEEAPKDREVMKLMRGWEKDVLIEEIMSWYPLPSRVKKMIR